MTPQLKVNGLVNAVLGVSALLVVVSLGVAGYSLMTQGHSAFNTTSDGMFWGLPIVTYDYLVVMSTGLVFVACLAFVFDLTEFYPVAKRCLWLGFATLIAGGAALMLELGHPLRSLYAIPLNMQYRSPMFWKVLFIGAYVILLLVLFFRISTAEWRRRSARPVAIALFFAALGLVFIAGALFGMMAMRPFWYDGLMPVYFLVEGVMTGLAFAILVTHVAHGFNQTAMPAPVRALVTGTMPKLFAAVIGVQIVMLGARAVAGAWSNADGLQVWDEILASPLFWLEAGLGLAAPFLLMLGRTRANSVNQALSAVLVLLGGFIGRYEFITGGQSVPLFKGSWVPGFVEYAPSFTEWMLTLLAVSIAFAIYAVGEKLFDLSATPRQSA